MCFWGVDGGVVVVVVLVIVVLAGVGVVWMAVVVAYYGILMAQIPLPPSYVPRSKILNRSLI